MPKSEDQGYPVPHGENAESKQQRRNKTKHQLSPRPTKGNSASRLMLVDFVDADKTQSLLPRKFFSGRLSSLAQSEVEPNKKIKSFNF